MRRFSTIIEWLALLLAVLCFSAAARATTTVTGNLKTLGTGALTTGASVKFDLRNCGTGNRPIVSGTGVLAQISQSFQPDATTGSVSIAVYASDEITCAGQATTYYHVSFINGGTATSYGDSQLYAGSPFNLNSALTCGGATPAGTSCWLVNPPAPPVQQGATGAKGDPGTVTATGVNGDFTVPGILLTKDFSYIRFSRAFSGANTAAQEDAACADLAGSSGLIVTTTGQADGATSGLLHNCTVLDVRGGRSPDGLGNIAEIRGGLGVRTRWTLNQPGVQNLKALSIYSEAFSGGHNGVPYGGDTSKANYTSNWLNGVKRTPGQQITHNVSTNCTSVGDCFGFSSVVNQFGGLVNGVGDEGANAHSSWVIQGDSNGVSSPNVFRGTVTAVSGTTLTLTTSYSNSLGDSRAMIVTTPAKIYSTGTVTTSSGTQSIVGAGTSWLTLCPGGVTCTYTEQTSRVYLSLNHYDFNDGTNITRWVLPVCTVTDDTHISLCPGVAPNYNAAGEAYKIFKGSPVTTLVTTIPWTSGQLAVNNAADFTVGDTVEQPLHWNFSATVIKSLCMQVVGPAQCVGMFIDNLNTNPAMSGTDAILYVGNWQDLGRTQSTAYVQNGFIFDGALGASTEPAGTGAGMFFRDTTVNNVLNTIKVAKSSGGTALQNYDRSTDTWGFSDKISTNRAFFGNVLNNSTQILSHPDCTACFYDNTVPYNLRVIVKPLSLDSGADIYGFTGDPSPIYAGYNWKIANSGATEFTSVKIGAGSTVSFDKVVTDTPGAITVTAQTCTDRSIAISGIAATARISVGAGYALEANLGVNGGQADAGGGNAHYRICNPTAGNITLAAGSTFTVEVRQ